MWTKMTLALLTAATMAGGLAQPALAYSTPLAACPALQVNNDTNRAVPPDHVFDTTIQQWLDPNTPGAMEQAFARNGCYYGYAARGPARRYSERRAYEERRRAEEQQRYYDNQAYGNYYDPYGYNRYGYNR